MMWFIERVALGSLGFHLPVANHRLNILVENSRNKETHTSSVWCLSG